MLSLGQTPALPLDDAGAYVAAAYVVFLALLIVYLGIMALRLKRVEKQMREIEAARAADPESPDRATGGSGSREGADDRSREGEAAARGEIGGGDAAVSGQAEETGRSG